MSQALIDQFAAWLRDNRLAQVNLSLMKKIWFKLAFWARPINITKNKEIGGKQADLYFEIPWNLLGRYVASKLRYKYGVFVTDSPADYLELDLNGFVFLSQITDEILEQIKEYNGKHQHKGAYWKRSSATIYDKEEHELVKPDVAEETMFESFLRQQGELEG